MYLQKRAAHYDVKLRMCIYVADNKRIEPSGDSSPFGRVIETCLHAAQLVQCALVDFRFLSPSSIKLRRRKDRM